MTQPETVRQRVQARLFRFELGGLGDYRSLGAGLLEARLHFGPGYRIYFSLVGERNLLLLGGGSKHTQSRDIAAAKWNLAHYEKRGKNGTKK